LPLRRLCEDAAERHPREGRASMSEKGREAAHPAILVNDLQGSLEQTNILDLLQFLCASVRNGELMLHRLPDGMEGRVYYAKGTPVHVVVGDLSGMDALVELVGWDEGSFRFSQGVPPPRTSIVLPPQQALLEAVRLHDEGQRPTTPRSADERDEATMIDARTSADVLEDFLKIPAITSAVIIGRDGVVIESSGVASAVSVEDLGASLARAIRGIEEMGAELQVQAFQDLFVEYGRAVIICRPVGDAIIAVVAPDASRLGVVRHKIRPLVEELGDYY
jgi:predicted regulator of Ras-like GTPase activity (Roadblock/LC7/MglB family)